MNSQWEAFLETHPVTLQPREMPGAAQAAFPACALMDLSHLGLISASGDDAAGFLQGQTTNDVREVTDDRFQLSGYCTPKGRLQANFLLFRHRQALLLQMPLDTHQIMLKRLPMFVLRSKVSLEDASDRLVRLGLAGACASDLLQAHFERLPPDPWGSLQESDMTLLRLPGEPVRFEVIGEPEPMIELWERLSRSAEIASGMLWSLMDIRAGIPVIRGATSEAFVPQMANMQLIGGVSFTKGCYTGQEVVARMKYLGKIKRRMYLAHVESDSPPQAGDELFSAGSTSGQGAGRIVDAQPAPEGGYDLLAVVEIEQRAADDICLNGSNGPKLEFRALPYVFEQE